MDSSLDADKRSRFQLRVKQDEGPGEGGGEAALREHDSLRRGLPLQRRVQLLGLR